MNKLIYIILIVSFISFFRLDVLATTNTFTKSLSTGAKGLSNSDFTVNVTDKKINETTNSTKITGKLPVITTTSSSFDSSINSTIDGDFKNKVADIKKTNAKSATISYEVYTSNDTYSIVIQYTVKNLTDKTYVDTYVFDSEGSLLSITSYLGKSSTKILTSYINTLDVAKDNKVDIKKNQDFYVNDGLLNLVFDSGVLNPVYDGAYTISINPNSIKSKTISSDSYFIQEPFSTRMVPLDEVATFFGYTVDSSQTDKVVLTKGNFKSTIELNKKSDNYYKDGSLVKLETVPIMKNSTIYVPVTYFSDVLGLVYYFGEDSSITISSIN